MGWIPITTSTWFMQGFWSDNPNDSGAWKIDYKNDTGRPVKIVSCKFQLASGNTGGVLFYNSLGINQVADGRGCKLTARIDGNQCGSEQIDVPPQITPNASCICGCYNRTATTCMTSAFHTSFGPKTVYSFEFPDCPEILPNQTVRLTVRASDFPLPVTIYPGGVAGCTIVMYPDAFIADAVVEDAIPPVPPDPEPQSYNIQFDANNDSVFFGDGITHVANPIDIQRHRTWLGWTGTHPDWIENWEDPLYGMLPWESSTGIDNQIKSGYIFRGWQTNAIDGLQKQSSDVLDGDAKLYARWERIVNIWRYNGSKWMLDQATKKYNGSTFVRDVTLLKRYNGSQWVDPFGRHKNYT